MSVLACSVLFFVVLSAEETTVLVGAEQMTMTSNTPEDRVLLMVDEAWTVPPNTTNTASTSFVPSTPRTRGSAVYLLSMSPHPVSHTSTTASKFLLPEAESVEKTVHSLAAEDCAEDDIVLNITDKNATLRVMNLVDETQRVWDLAFNRIYCIVRLAVPHGLYMRMTVEDQKMFTCDDILLTVTEFSGNQYEDLSDCYFGRHNLVYPKSTEVLVVFSPYKHGPAGTPWLTVHFEAISQPGRQSLPYMATSPLSTVYTSSDFQQRPYAHGMSSSVDLTIPLDYLAMISFPFAEIGRYPTVECPAEGEGDIFSIQEFPSGIVEKIPYQCETKVVPPRTYIRYIQLNFTTDMYFTNTGFHLLFSLHPDSILLRIPTDGLYDCSVPEYTNFKQHLTCNLELECQGGEDERDCPFGHPPCNGSVGYGDRCFRLITKTESLKWAEAEQECRQQGGLLANLKTPGERQAINDFFTFGKRRWLFHVGARKLSPGTDPLLTMYAKLWQWRDGTIAYDINLKFKDFADCTYLNPRDLDFLHLWHCDEPDFITALKLSIKGFVCEFKNGEKRLRESIRLPNPTATFHDSFKHCPDGHMTRDFLSCDSAINSGILAEADFARLSSPNPAEAGSAKLQHSIKTISLFLCDSGEKYVHYSLLCDFWSDCRDGSDERFCVRPDCMDRTCQNKQCVWAKEWCDGVRHCVDFSDEKACKVERETKTQGVVTSIPPPVVIDLDGNGGASWRRLQNSESCPETHFRCPGQYVYCLPVYVRCNGVFDCPGHEDEAQCEDYTCPGFYRCRESLSCVHHTHVCDGIFQCPKQDDEWMCQRNLTCPDGCFCQGIAFSCSNPFHAPGHKELRYVDASGSGMTPDDLTALFHLVNLRLAYCGLTVVKHMFFPNLLFLDLSDNQLVSVSFNVFQSLENLRNLSLAGNPLVTLTGAFMSTNLMHLNLRHVDISRTNIVQFSSRAFSKFKRVAVLNISHSSLATIRSPGFLYLNKLEQLDLRFSPVENFPSNVFRDLQNLRQIWTDNFKLCCGEALPANFDSRGCVAPPDEISSCEDLLRSDVYRLCLWIFACLAVLGNAGCFFFRLLNRKNASKTGFSVFVTNLSVADFLMGVYLVVIGSADSVYRGKYLWFETAWKKHAVCELAGFLSLLSNEVSAFIICLITLDRFIVLRFPFSTLYFKRRSAMMACGIAWTFGILLAAGPLFPGMAKWEFYSQTGICIPLPITRQSFQGRDYSFGVMIALNFVLFLLVAAGQLIIYLSVRSNVMASDTNRKSQDMTVARRLLTVAISDFLCWFPIGLLGLLASRGTPISGEVNVGMAIFVLPLNSALNPFLYTFNMLMEKRRRKEEKDMLSWFEANVLAKRQAETGNTVSTTNADSADVDQALQYIKNKLEDGSLPYTELLAYLNFVSDE